MKIFGGFLIGYLQGCQIHIEDRFDELSVKIDEMHAELEAVKLRADTLKNSLVNNNLLTQCTVQGFTNEWTAAADAPFQMDDGAFYVEG